MKSKQPRKFLRIEVKLRKADFCSVFKSVCPCVCVCVCVREREREREGRERERERERENED